jgi:hypothetical protein
LGDALGALPKIFMCAINYVLKYFKHYY